MAYPVADSYSVAAGETIYAGVAAPSLLFSGTAVLAGDSLTALTYPSGPYRWWLPLLGSPVKSIYNAGVANDTLDLSWARWSTDVAAKNSDGVILRLGTNNAEMDKATFKAKFKRFTDWIVANGKWGILNAIPPKAGITASIVANNEAIAELAAASGGRIKFCADGWVLALDGSYTYDPACFIDGIHHNPHGQYLSGLYASSISAAWFAPSDPRIKSALDTYYLNALSDQWVKNPMMAGTGGTKYNTTGVVATDWAVNANGGGTSAVCSIVAADAGDADQTPWQRITPTFGAGGHAVGAAPTLSHPAIASDMSVIKRLDIVCEVRLNLDTTNLNTLSYGVSDAGVPVSAGETMGLLGNGVINKTFIARVSYPRDQNGAAVRAHAANSLAMGIGISSANACSGIGYIDFRLASVRGQGA